MMELAPDLSIGWLNGWLVLLLLSLTEGIFFLTSPKYVVRRLFDRSGWSHKQRVYTIAGKVCALVCLVLICLTPLKIGSQVFNLGLLLVAIGLIGLVRAMFDFKNTPLGEPVTRGLYQVSRHPQIVMASLVLLGACVATGSWLALGLLVASRIFQHWGILAEEEVCLKQYGDAYSAYLKQVPRYFGFFNIEKVLRWIARITSMLVTAFWLLILLDIVVCDVLVGFICVNWEIALLAGLVLASLLSVLIAWRWEGIGSLVMICWGFVFAAIAYATSRPQEIFSMLVTGVPFMIAGILFLASWWFSQWTTRRNWPI